MIDIDEILHNTQKARLMLHAFQSLLDNSDAMLFIKDAKLVYQAANMNFVHMVGKTRLEDVISHSDFDIFDDPLLAQRYVADDHRLFAENTDVISYIEPLPQEEGKSKFASTSKYILRGQNGDIIGLAGISRDITHDLAARENHQKEISYLFNLPENAFMAVYMDVTDWRIISERQQDIHKNSFHMHENADSLAQKAQGNVSDLSSPAYAFYRDFRPDALQEIYKSGQRAIVMEYLRKFDGGDERWVRDEIKLMVDPSNNHLCLMLTVWDIHDRKQGEVNLMWAAERDIMTGILNHDSTIKYIKQFLDTEGKYHTHALFVIDMDNFKQINDTYGHQAGDRFIAHIAQTIRGNFRDSDIIGRIGGDEFLVLMKFVPNVEVVKEKGEDLLATLRETCSETNHLNVSGSIGVSLYNNENDCFEGLFEKADQAMYSSKRNGKGQLFFSSDMFSTDS